MTLQSTTAPTVPNPPPAWRDAAPEDWSVLRALCGYRFVLAALLLSLQASGYLDNLFETVANGLFRDVCLGYIAAAALLLATTFARRPNLPVQVYLHYAIDTTAIILLTYACNGIGSGLGMLLITPVVTCSLILPTRTALLLAALTTFSVFGEEIFRQLRLLSVGSESTSAGILGLALFATATAGNAMARRARRSEARAARARTELATLLQLNKRIVDTMQTGVLSIEADGRIGLSNTAARRLLTAGGIDHQPLASVAPALWRALENWRNGENREDEVGGLLLRFSALDQGPRHAARTLVLLDDATRLRQHAQQLKLASLGQLTANVAHEIRNPLAAITQAGELLAESTASRPDDRELAAVIGRQGARIDKIVRDILSLSRSNAARPEVIDLQPWLARCIQAYRESCPAAALHLDTHKVPAQLRLCFDPNHLQRVLHNLWNNSAEHAGHGGHPVHVSMIAGHTAGGQPCLTVENDGPGIAPALAEHIFEPFFTTAHNGTGLGLYIARELCEYNRAVLSYQTHNGHACFRIMCTADVLRA